MIFLSDNAFVERDLKFEDIKPRLLGHWGTCPGLTLVYAHLNYLTRKNDLDLIYVVGPGHGAPAILASVSDGEKPFPICDCFMRFSLRQCSLETIPIEQLLTLPLPSSGSKAV
jgi:hypothetical protein